MCRPRKEVQPLVIDFSSIVSYKTSCISCKLSSNALKEKKTFHFTIGTCFQTPIYELVSLDLLFTSPCVCFLRFSMHRICRPGFTFLPKMTSLSIHITCMFSLQVGFLWVTKSVAATMSWRELPGSVGYKSDRNCHSSYSIHSISHYNGLVIPFGGRRTKPQRIIVC